MKTLTAPLSQRDQTTRRLAPIYCAPTAFFTGSPDSLGYVLTLTCILLHIIFVIVAWFTRDRATAIVAILTPFATIGIGIALLILRIGATLRGVY